MMNGCLLDKGCSALPHRAPEVVLGGSEYEWGEAGTLYPKSIFHHLTRKHSIKISLEHRVLRLTIHA